MSLLFVGVVHVMCPGALVVDVATLRSGRTVVVETSPVWCAGFLSAPREVLATSQFREQVVDRYGPDAAVQLMLTETPLS